MNRPVDNSCSFLLVALAIVGALLVDAGCQRPIDSDGRGHRDQGQEDRPADLKVFGALDTSDDAHTRRATAPDGRTLFLAASPIVTGEDVEHAMPSVDANGNNAILLVLDDKSAERMHEASQQYMHHWLVFVWNGRIISAPRISGELSKQLMILQYDDQTSQAEHDAILRALAD